MIAYHITELSSFMDGIREQGLVPQIGERAKLIGETETRTHLFASLEDVETGLTTWMADAFDEDSSIVLLELNIDSAWAARHIRQEEGQFELWTDQVIPADRIVRVLDESLQVIGDPKPLSSRSVARHGR